MKGRQHKLFAVLFISGLLVTCIDPFSPDLEKFDSLLVVDALVTDENISNYVRLSRTMQKMDDKAEKVTGATVSLTDDLGNISVLSERAPGDYRTDSLTFRGAEGRLYTLRIITTEGDEYESGPCMMYPVSDIDSLYFKKETEVTSIEGETLSGVRFYINSGEESANIFFRWTYEECWKFAVPEPKKYNYINDSTIVPNEMINWTCWSSKKSDEILIDLKVINSPAGFFQKAITFIPADKSNRFTIQYSILVKQLSISAEEYEFWNRMQQINETGGDIFDKQPFPVTSNIYNKSNSSEQVLGYFQVSAVRQERIYVTENQIEKLGLPAFRYDCERIEKGVIDYITLSPPPVTFDKIYNWYTTAGFDFIEPVYGSPGKLLRLVFVPSSCADCTCTGNIVKPDFWVDL